MIRPINIKLNAAHPELPLIEATTFTGAPSSVFIRGVPKAVGNWSITAVNVAVTYPDNSTTTRAAVESAEGVWVATIPGTATSGRTVAGFRILADGIDENGAAVTGYVLGFADFAVLSFFPVPAPGETFFYLRYFDTMPTTAKKMDVTTIDGILKYYNGTTWLPFADLTNYYTKVETDNKLAEKVARTELFPAWAANTAYTTYSLVIHDNAVYKCTTSHTSGAEWDSTKWAVATGAEVLAILLDYLALANKPQLNGVELSGNKTGADVKVLDLDGGTMKYDAEIIFGAQRVGDHAIIISKTGVRKAAATLNGSWQKLWDDLAVVSQIPDVSTKADSSSIAAAFDASKQGGYAVGDVVMYNGARYRCTTAHTGAWDAAHFETQTVEAAKADDNAVVHKTGDQQTMSAVLQLLSTLYAESGVESHGDYRLTWTVGGDYAGELTISQDMISVQLADEIEPRQYKLQAGGGGMVALLENIAPEFVYRHPYGVDELCTSYDADSSHKGYWLYKCIVATDGSTPPELDTTHWTPATVEDVLAALRTAIAGKADASDLPYAISASIPLTVTSGAASTTLDDRTHNVRTVAAPGSGNTTTITATLPPIVQGKSRDMFLNLTVGTQASDAGDISISIVEPSGATVQIDIGSVEDIGIGKNEILISENALPTTSGNVTITHWLVTVRHEDFAS